jgi:TPR repeat protein
MKGQIAPKNTELAKKYLEPAAKKGNLGAQIMLKELNQN